MTTQTQLANKLGVSRQLVGLALSGYPKVSAATRRRVLQAAKDAGYRPNPLALALRRQRTGVVALWLPSHLSTYFMRVNQELHRITASHGYELITSEVKGAEGDMAVSQFPVDGVFVLDTPLAVKTYRQSRPAQPVPMISLGVFRDPNVDSIHVELAAGVKQLMQHLIGSGYRRIAMMTFAEQSRPKETRCATYQQSMKTAGLRPVFIHYKLGVGLRARARSAIRRYIKTRGRPEAVFCHNDDVAIGAYRGLLDLGVRVPEDVAVAGCDGIEDVEYLERPLTTVVQPVGVLCEKAWEMLERRMNEPRARRQLVQLQPALAIRDSTVRGKA